MAVEVPKRLLVEQLPVCLKTGKVVLGSEETYVAIKSRKAKLAVIAKNARKDLKDEILRLAKARKIPVVMFNGPSVELGIVCGKPYVVSALAILDFGVSKLKEVLSK